jgi:hypothetical protein
MLDQLQVRHVLPKVKLQAIVEFGRLMDALPEAYLALERFDMVADRERQREYGNNLFAGFYTLTQRGLLVVSHQPYAALVPPGHPVSLIAFDTVELRRLP